MRLETIARHLDLEESLRRAMDIARLFTNPIAGGGTISVPFTFSPNTIIQSAQVNSCNSTIYNDYNGNITDANVSAITETKITFTATGHAHSGGAGGAPVQLLSGSAITSAASITIPTDGNYFSVTGAVTITSIGTRNIGVLAFLKFAGALTFTHNATSLILPGGASITTAAGDIAVMVSEGSGNWRCIAYQKASGQAVAGAAVRPKFTGLQVYTDPNTPNTKVRIVADTATLIDANGLSKTFTNVDVTCDLSLAAGVGSIDTGTIAANTGYDIVVVGKPDNTVGAVASKGLQWAAGVAAVSDSDRSGTIALRDASARTQIGQKIPSTVSTGKLHSVDVSLIKVTTPSGDVWAELQSDSAGKPSGVTLAGGIGIPVPVDDMDPTNRFRMRFIFPERPTLTNGTVYHIVFKGDFTIGASNLTFGTGTAGTTILGLSSFDGATWTVDNAKGLALFNVNILTGAESVVMPSGYTYSGRCSWNITNGSSVLFKMWQRDTRVEFGTKQSVTNATATVWTASDLSALLPPSWVTRYYLHASNLTAADSTHVADPLPLGLPTSGGIQPWRFDTEGLGNGRFDTPVDLNANVGPMAWTSLNAGTVQLFIRGFDLDI